MQFIQIHRCSSSPTHVVSQFNPDSPLRDEVRWDEDHITQTKFEERMGCQLKQGHLPVSCGKSVTWSHPLPTTSHRKQLHFVLMGKKSILSCILGVVRNLDPPSNFPKK